VAVSPTVPYTRTRPQVAWPPRNQLNVISDTKPQTDLSRTIPPACAQHHPVPGPGRYSPASPAAASPALASPAPASPALWSVALASVALWSVALWFPPL
jgi:hypothetical protein